MLPTYSEAGPLRDLRAQNSSSQQLIDQRRNSAQQNESRISRNEAADIASRATGGRVLKVTRKGNYYEVRVLVDGERVRTVRVDARSGQVR